jgi:phosphate transport system substrate-binding protein
MKHLRRLAFVGLALGLGFGVVGCGGCGGGGGSKRLEGAGSTFVEPMMKDWVGEYKKEKNQEVNYQGGGSGAGFNKMVSKEVDFGCSDAPLTDEQVKEAKDKGGDFIHVPIVAGAIAIVYNVPGFSEHDTLVLDRDTLIGIYTYKITNWKDPRILDLQTAQAIKDKLSQLSDQDAKILPAARSDPSGSTYILTDYFSKAGKDAWAPGKGTEVGWPEDPNPDPTKRTATAKQPKTAGVAKYVKDTKGAVGYVELTYALENKLSYASLKNHKKQVVKPDTQSVLNAAKAAEIPDDFRQLSITDADADQAYPISGVVFLIAFTKQQPGKGKALVDFLTWVLHDGQKRCEALHYTPLPENIVKKVDEKIKAIEAK